MLLSNSISARIAADPTQRANERLGSWQEKPLGVEVVVPMTVCKESVDWYGEGFSGDRALGLRTGEFDGVILRDPPGPTNLFLPLHGGCAITSSDIDSRELG